MTSGFQVALMRLLFSAVLTVVMSGCAGISKEECLYADWRAIGYEDGSAGKSASAISSRRAACAKKAGVAVDMAEYTAGRESGLRNFCRPSNGYALGANGGRYYGVCVDAEESGLLAAFETGRQLFGLQQAVASYERQIVAAEKELSYTQDHIASVQIALVSPETPMVDRPALLLELKDLDREKDDIEIALVALHNALINADEDLAAFRDHLALNGPIPRGVHEPSSARY